jgi:hypothetical protein
VIATSRRSGRTYRWITQFAATRSGPNFRRRTGVAYALTVERGVPREPCCQSAQFEQEPSSQLLALISHHSRTVSRSGSGARGSSRALGGWATEPSRQSAAKVSAPRDGARWSIPTQTHCAAISDVWRAISAVDPRDANRHSLYGVNRAACRCQSPGAGNSAAFGTAGLSTKISEGEEEWTTCFGQRGSGRRCASY